MTLATVNPMSTFEVLDIHAEGGVATAAPRIDALATISAGRKVRRGDKFIPEISRDGTIILHDPEGRAPGLAAILGQSPKQLTITFPFDDPRRFIQQRFARYSATRLEVYGNQLELIEIVEVGKGSDGKPEYIHEPHPAGSPRYRELLATCKTTASVYFLLAEWRDGEPRILMPDGVGMYRLRFTSRNSLSNLVAQLRLISEFTGGRFAGVPFTLRLVYREAADPSGTRRTVPVWTITPQHPAGHMDSRVFRQLLAGGLAEAQRLSLPVPRDEDVAAATADTELTIDLDEADLTGEARRMLESGVAYDSRLREWHGVARGTNLGDEEVRHAFVAEHTPYASIADAARYLDDTAWRELLAAAVTQVAEAEQARVAVEAAERAADPEQYPPGVTEVLIEFALKQFARTGLAATEWRQFVSWLVAGNGEAISANTDLTADVLQIVIDRLGETRGQRYRPAEIAEVRRLVGEYQSWAASDAAASEVLG